MKRLILTALLGLFWTSIVFANNDDVDDIKKYNFWWEQIPAVCSYSDEIQRWATDNNFIPVNMSLGREGGTADGRIVYIVVYYINDSGQTFAGVSTPENPEQTCIVFRTFDLVINEGLKEKEL